MGARLSGARSHRPGVCRPNGRAELAAGVGQRVHDELRVAGVDVPARPPAVSPCHGSTAGQRTGMDAVKMAGELAQRQWRLSSIPKP